MSLLDDVSIVVTPNAYKASKLYAVLPTNVEGSELITNGDFSGGTTGWNAGAGWSIGSGKASVDNASSTPLTQSGLAVITGKKYNVSFEISDYVSGGFQFQFGGSQVVGSVNANGVYNFSAISTVNTTVLYLYGTGDCEFKVDNVTCKQDTGADMSVTRATAATRVDENGLVNFAEVLGSELVTNGNFDSNITGWSAKSSTIVWDNGKLKADNSSGNQYGGAYQNIGLVAGKEYKMTLTMQLLTGSSNGTFMLFTSTATGDGQSLVYTGGALVVGGAAVTETFYFTPGSGDVSIQFTCDEANATYTIDNVSVKEVTRNNVPRIDYTVGGCPHILAEPQRTNLLVKSNDYSSNWVITGTGSSIGGSVTGISQDINGTSLTLASGGLFYSSITPISNGVMSIYMRVPSGTVDLQLGDPVGSPYETKTLTTTWQRFSVVDTGSLGGLAVYNSISGTTITIEVCAAQVELGSYPTSYIPTSGSAVTRNKDIFTRDGISSLINSTEGVLFAEIAALSDDETNREITLSDGSSNNYVLIRFNNGGSNRIYTRVDVGGGIQYFNLNTSHTITDINKIAIKWKNSNFCTFINGVKVSLQLSGSTFSANTLSELNFDNGTGANNFFGKVKQLQVYKTALTDAQLTSLTS